MAHQQIEMILMRQLASTLATPILILDPEGNLLFFNEPAEPILGCRFDETGQIRRSDWNRLFQPRDQDGEPIQPESGPLVHALTRREPSHRRFWIRGLDGVSREIEGLAFPLSGVGDRHLGVVGIFWEIRRT